MGMGWTHYECRCGGTITEVWGSDNDYVKCNKCDNPLMPNTEVYSKEVDFNFEMVDWVFALRRNGYEDKDITKELVGELKGYFREEQIKELLENNLYLADIEGWLHLEKTLNAELDKETALGIINLLWEKDIHIMDCGE